MGSSPHSCECPGGWVGGVFTALPDSGQSRRPLLPRNNVGLSAVCAYNLSTAEAVFSRGKYMQSATVEQSHTKWVRYNGAVPTPRPGAVSGPGSLHGERASTRDWEGPWAHSPFPGFFSSVCCVTAVATNCPNKALLAGTSCSVGLTLRNKIRAFSFSVSCRETHDFLAKGRAILSIC